MNKHYLLTCLGPNQILPADRLWTSEVSGCVRLQFEENKGVASQPPISVPGLLHRTATNFPHSPALSQKTSEGLWKDISFKYVPTYKVFDDLTCLMLRAFRRSCPQELQG